MEYRDKIYSNYRFVGLNEIEKQFPVWKNYFGEFLPSNKETSIIDLGCGNGGFVYWLKKFGFTRVSGVDLNEEQISRAKALGVEATKGDFRELLKSKKNEYGLIFARDLLEHVKKDEVLDSLEIIHSALKEGGLLIIQSVNAGNILWGRLRHGDFTHETAFTEKSLRQLLGICGFRDVRIYSQGPVVHGFKSLARFAAWKFFDFAVRIYLIAETGSGRGVLTPDILVAARK